jgi:hypothetical protein
VDGAKDLLFGNRDGSVAADQDAVEIGDQLMTEVGGGFDAEGIGSDIDQDRVDGLAETDRLVLLPIGQGIYDHKCVLDLLKRHAYGDFVSGEWIDWEPYETHLPRELATLKRYEAELA